MMKSNKISLIANDYISQLWIENELLIKTNMKW